MFISSKQFFKRDPSATSVRERTAKKHCNDDSVNMLREDISFCTLMSEAVNDFLGS